MHAKSVFFLAACTSSVIMISAVSQVSTDEQLDNKGAGKLGATQDYAPGDPRRCLEVERRNGYQVQRFEVLPGFGWDNLRNLDQGQVVRFNFSQCRTTDDGRFLLPDSVTAVPIKASKVENFAELISHYQDWTSTDSHSVNIDASLSLTKVGVSGKFSAEFQEMKSKQIGDKSVTTRAQVRYVRYAVQLQPDTPLHPVFRGRLLDIAAEHELNNKEQARYLSQLLVRDFGTHIITKALAGAALIKVDHVDENWMKNHIQNKRDILASASLSLFSVFNMKASYENKHDDNFYQDYRKSLTSSSVETKGGALFKPENFTTNQWADEVDSDLVALDRSGDPLYYVITAATLPELPASTLNQVATSVRDAVETYYDFNTVPGCVDKASPSFSPAANVDDGSCNPPPSNLTFGGMYQTCTMLKSENGDLCGGMTQVNPLTGGFTCPPNYQTVLLHRGSMRTSRSEHHCKKILFWKTGCHDVFYESKANYEMYWCAATGHVAQNSGYLFGGLFTSRVPNPITRKFACPSSFFPLKMGDRRELQVCISDDYEFSREKAVPLAGFISCEAGNPLAMADTQEDRNMPKASGPGAQTHSLRAYYSSQTNSWPQRCPDGYSKHLATIDQGCQINYCVQTGAMAGPTLPPVKRPPFTPPPPLSAPLENNQVVFDPETRTWRKNQYTAMMTLTSAANEEQNTGSESTQGITPAGAAGITLGAVAVFVLIISAIMLAVRARRRRRSEYRSLAGSRTIDNPGYGSANSMISVNSEAE